MILCCLVVISPKQYRFSYLRQHEWADFRFAVDTLVFRKLVLLLHLFCFLSTGQLYSKAYKFYMFLGFYVNFSQSLPKQTNYQPCTILNLCKPNNSDFKNHE